MAGRVEGSWRCSRSGENWRRCSWRHASGGMRGTELSSLGILLLLIHSAQPYEDDISHESSGSAVSFLDVATSPSFLIKDETPLSAVHSNSTGSSKGNREQPAFSSILTLLAGTDQRLPKDQLPKVSPENPVISNNETHQWLSNRSLERIESSFTLPSSSELASNHSSISGLFPSMQFADFLTTFFKLNPKSALSLPTVPPPAFLFVPIIPCIMGIYM
ncbi:uncharacterized protein LOC130563220 [Triplophysa rosa]|uniref:uncharacterized protein LOC130563220 n=1 Tax=Triplophysa rosa TaxID=992332 RepID=UPI00254627A7|nr:uncharacterized protein LOC130563220 [Triplophysa rosa]